MAERVGQILGNYQLLRLLGHGAFAEVYLAEHRYLEVPAAIKVLHVRMEPDTQEQFLREARTIAHLQHPHILRVLDFGFQDQTPFLVMEYTPNGTLRDRHPRGTPLPLEQIVTYVKQIAPALDYAHQQRVIHRDVKPENMLLSATDELVLSDFGIAVIQHTTDSLSTQDPAGTPLYMAPEQIRGKPCAASDQYALGVLVYEWLCGEPPFHGRRYEVLAQHLHELPPGLGARVPHLPPAVEDAVFGALAKEPHARFASVQEFAEVLEAVCEATQTLALRASSDRLSREQSSPPDLLPSPQEQAGSSSTTQPHIVVRQHTADREESVALEVLPPASQTHASSGREGVPVSRTNRQRLVRKVRAYWIAGVFEHSLHGAALLALGLQEQPEAVANPWQLVLQHPAGAPRPLPAGTHIKEVYDAAEGELLILGAPGSGKTTLLLELARELLSRAEHDEQHPLPVVFNLSSWAMKQQRLADWLVEELNSTYQVPRKLGQTWVEADQILPLLDGLDEVAPRDRTACIESINTYRQEHGLLPLVVCSRSADYLAQAARIQLGSAVAVQPLTQQQVDDYLASGGEPVWALRVALQQDAALRELTSTPLMLSILTLTYHGLPVEELLRKDSLTDLQRQIFEHYVERMLRQRGTQPSYTPEQTIHWLRNLAGQMKQQSQTIFYLEQMQPTWLSSNWRLGMYTWLGVRLPCVLMGILVSLFISLFVSAGGAVLSVLPFTSFLLLGGLLGWLLSEGNTSQRPTVSVRNTGRTLGHRLLQWLFIGALIGLGSGLSAWLIYAPRVPPTVGLSVALAVGLSTWLSSILLQFLLGKNNPVEVSSQTPSSVKGKTWQHLVGRRAIRNGLLAGLSIGLSSGLFVGLYAWLISGLLSGLGGGLIFGLGSGLIFGLSAGLLSILLIGSGTQIQPTELLVWSWRSLRKSLFLKSHISTTLRITALIVLSIGLPNLLFSGLSYWFSGQSQSDEWKYVLINGLSIGLTTGLSIGLSYWLLLGLFEGVVSTTIEDQRRVVPNQGIHRSALNGLVLGLISIVIVGLLSWLVVGLSYWLLLGLNYGLGAELSYGLSNPDPGLGYWLSAMLSIGLLVGLLKGGLASLRHYVLRFLLWRAGTVPWHYVRFLDYAAECILLRKVGGGYIFVHRLLLEYFASLDSTPAQDEARAQTQQAQPVP